MTPEAMLAHHARSFSPATRLLARADRARIARLYALCRTVDDLADTVGGAQVEDRLTMLARDIAAGDGTDPLAVAAAALFTRRPEGRLACADLVRTVAADTGATCIADDMALDAYCMGVAGTVGVMICTLFDVPVRWHRPAAELGKAMQLTNICRDVAEDARAGRRYLPYDLCPHAPDAIAAGTPLATADVRHAVTVLLARADALYASGRRGLPALPLRLRLAVAAAAAMYAGIGNGLRTQDCNPLTGRVIVPGWRKAVLAGQGVIATVQPPRKRQKGSRHAVR